jgi:hypothetical protein
MFSQLSQGALGRRVPGRTLTCKYFEVALEAA